MAICTLKIFLNRNFRDQGEQFFRSIEKKKKKIHQVFSFHPFTFISIFNQISPIKFSSQSLSLKSRKLHGYKKLKRKKYAK